jgi:hypothetical protein
LLNKALSLKESIWTIKDSSLETDSSKPAWNNGYLPGLDIVGIYTLLTEFKPRKYIEIGSGNSTKVAYKAKIEQNLDTEIISIDPMPRAEIDILADKIIRKPFENVDFDIVNELNENDILFVDIHIAYYPILMPWFSFSRFCQGQKRVIVHIHDIYLPYDYPQDMCDRFLFEQYGLAMYLLANPQKYEPLMPNYFIFEDKELSALIAPIWNHKNLQNVEKHGGSFWLKIAE